MSYHEDNSSRTEQNGIEPEYRYVPQAEVSKTLESFGYGPSKKYVDALYIGNNIGIGVLQVTDDHCRDHFGVFRGVDQGEAAGQTLLLFLHFTVGIPGGQSPLLQGITVQTENPAFPGSVLNISVTKAAPEGNSFSGKGIITSGSVPISRVEISGRTIRSDLLQRLIERSRRIQGKSVTKFPFKG